MFVLLHLRNKTNKNPINVKIPDICVFIDRSPFDVIFSQNGFVRGLKSSEQQRLKLKDAFNFFKSRWSNESIIEQNTASFTVSNKSLGDESYNVMVSDNELFLICNKIKRDPFFNNLDYLQSKLNP